MLLVEQLKQERRRRKLTQAQVARRIGLGVTQSSISDWERGAKIPTLPYAERWAEALGLSIVALPDRAVNG